MKGKKRKLSFIHEKDKKKKYKCTIMIHFLKKKTDYYFVTLCFFTEKKKKVTYFEVQTTKLCLIKLSF